MISRRALLMTGGATILVAGAFSASVLSRDAPSVREPWADAATGFGDPRLDALAFAILAPNPHNRQPWWVRLDEPHELTLYCDLNRLLPETDPPNRQITIGLGAFIELYRMAAAQKGYGTEIRHFPEGEPYPLLDQRPIAKIRLIEEGGVAPDPLFDCVLARRTARNAFSASPVAPETLEEMVSLANVSDPALFSYTTDASLRQTLKTLCRDSWFTEMMTPHVHHESTVLTRIGASEVRQNPDGISLYGPMMEAYKAVGILDRKTMDDTTSRGFQGTLQFYNRLIDSAQAFGWLNSPSNRRVDQLTAGADWLRLNLAATKLGLSMHPLSQALQEFPEMAEHYAALHNLLGVAAPNRIQGLFRFGYSTQPRPSPRWPMMSRIANLDA